MEFLAIPIRINSNVQYFYFQYSEKDKYGQVCHITSLDKDATVDEEFTIIKTNMPEFWLKPMLDKLSYLVNNKDLNP